MATGDFDTYYSDNPWEVVDKNQRTWYDPDLIALFRQRALFTPTIQFVKNLGDVRATKMVMNQLLDPHPDNTALAVRQIWMPASHIDSRQIEVEFSRYGGKVAYTRYDDIVTYWRQNGQAGVRRIVRGALGQHMIDVLDLLARNAYVGGALDTGYVLYEGGGADFDDVLTSHTFDITKALDIWLGMSLRNVASALGVAGAANNIICYTSPSVIYDIQKGTSSDEWIAVNEYQGRVQALRYEVGTYKNVRFVQSPKLVLWNNGTLIAQGLIDSAITAGDGAPDPSTPTKVDATYLTGQTTAGITNYISVGSWDTGSLAEIDVNDIICIHKTKTADYGVTDGVDFQEGTLHYRRVISKSATPDRIVLDRPIMVDFDTDLGSCVYGYVTKARNIHASIFVGGPQGIVSGVAMPPMFHAPPAVDDFEMVQRFSWDAYLGHQPYAPEVFEVVFSAGTTRVKGAAGVV
jgi:N4-gp56 family major capsid protein